MTDLDALLSAISAAMDAPSLAERAESFTGMAQISLLIALAGFLMIWKSIERQLAAGIASQGDLHWTFWQSFRVAALVFLLATLLDSSLLAAALGDPSYLVASQAISAISANEALLTEGVRIESDQRASIIIDTVRGHARSTLLHAGASFAAGLFIIICIARRATPSFETQRSNWFGLAIMLGLFGWPGLTDISAWSALGGNIEPYLHASIGR